MTLRSAHFMPQSDQRLGNKYLLLERLGDGSHGWVWRAERLADGEIVAVKIPKELSRDDRALAEGRELLGIAGHPNLIRIFDMGRVPPEREWYAIEMEYFPSESLAQKLEQRSHHFGLTFERLFGIYRQVLNAVAYLAALDPPVSHGDLKPHNILVGQGDQVKVTDFGSSALPEEIYLRTRENGGTVLYAAPEFSDCTSRKGDFGDLLRGDIYSLGVLLRELAPADPDRKPRVSVGGLDDVPGGAERGGHAHKALEQVIIAMSGSFDILLDDGRERTKFHLNRSYTGLYVCPMIWRELDNFSSGSVCMVLASAVYDEADYYRDYAEFMRARWGS